ncbi:class I glutamine amidotransferase-like protein [Dendryphion nanum]|uniref:Class I glutamine amidotransferase-like protein n=1 Tax=Dendryphion nanum TaxID=256645 RepID=A0A9P9CX23_9PLEO|nr:class I glutamine amidotransferase-like protein [Dendryphion nanum]
MTEVSFLRNPSRVLHVGVILMGGETEIIDVMPIDMLHGMGKKFIGDFSEMFGKALVDQAFDMEFHWVNEKGNTARLTSNIKLEATDSFESCPPLDIVLLGAHNPTMHTLNEAELAYLRKAYQDSSAFITVCGGVLPAQASGVLVGKTATAPRFMLDILRKNDPRTTWVEKRYVTDGKLWTSGALFNGVDLMRAFIIDTWGKEREELVSMCLEMGSVPVRNVDY